jgi:hypothetical protein
VPEPPRPTIRCLFEDLADTIEDSRLKSALVSKQLPDLGVRLHDIAHPIVAAARDRYSEGKPRARDRYRSVRDHPWVECRHGERWRGLVLWQPDVQCWLGFAGWHEADSPDDVYERFTRRCTSGSTIDSSRFLPTEDDELRLRAEMLQVRMIETRHDFHRRVLRCLLEAVLTPETEQETTLPDGSRLSIAFHPDGDIDELTLRIAIAWQGGLGAPIVEDVKDAVPGIAPGEWEIIPPGPTSLDPAFYACVDNSWVARLTEAAAAHGLDVLAGDPKLVLEDHDGAAHIVLGHSMVTTAYADGQVLRAICGHRFIPRADPLAAGPCRKCEDRQKQLGD